MFVRLLGAHLCAFVGVLVSGPAQAALIESQKIVAPIYQFSYSVAVDGNTLVSGALNNGAYLFDAATGTQTHLLSASGASGFGRAVAIDGTKALVGASATLANAGRAYVFDATTGTQIATLVATDAQTGDKLGNAVAISGNIALAAAVGDKALGSSSGSVYQFDATTGVQTRRLNAADGNASDRFGSAVAIAGNTIVVGASDKEQGALNQAGAVYLFDASTGAQTAKLSAADATASAFFGQSVAISGNVIAVGARGVSGNTGAVYLFNATTGAQLAKLVAPDGTGNDYFGWSVALSGNTLVVGAYQDDDLGDNSGSAYLFDVSTFAFVEKLVASDGAAGEWLGFSVATNGDRAFVGAHRDNSSTGAVYAYDLTASSSGGGVPLPASLPLLAAGLGLLAWRRRRIAA